MADFGSLKLVPSEANGPASVPAFLTPFIDAINQFVTSPGCCGGSGGDRRCLHQQRGMRGVAARRS